ncbi:MAG: hypothetical protein AAGD01_09775 [Acidobacteriota bacterium]
MSLIPIDRNPKPRQLAVFGTLWLLVFGTLGALGLRRHGGLEALEAGKPAALVWTTLLVLAVLIPALGWIWREVLRRAYVALTVLTWPIGWVISRLLLAIAYYLVLTPVGLALKLRGRDAMQRRLDPDAESYWQPKRPTAQAKRYYRQF